MTAGYSCPPRSRVARLTLPAAVAAIVATAATAQSRVTDFAIPATSLDAAIGLVGRIGGVDVVSTEPGLSRIRSRRIDARLTPRQALDRLLMATGYRAVAVDARSFRIVRDTPPPSPRTAARPPRVPAAAPAGDVIVTASKQPVPLLRYPGSLTMIAAPPATGDGAAGSLSDAARTSPVLQSTEFGPGRNKIFIRGIADSSFNGAVQSTASVYFGDVQLGYSGSDPSIRLYDMARVEVLEGPQGTLYGSGSIGGILRLTPAAPDLTRIAGSATIGGTATVGGAAGGDVAATLNLPVVADAVALRAVGYLSREGGYIDDLGTRSRDTNRIDTAGGRLALRVQPGGGWRVDLNALFQRNDGADAQYVDRRTGPLVRTSVFAQPYDNDVVLGSAALTKSWSDGLQLLAVLGLSSYHGHNLFDATPPQQAGRPTSPPVIYRTNDAKILWTQETRLSRTGAGGSGWVVGYTLLRNSDAENRSFGLARMPADIIGVTNTTKSASAFAEATLAVTPAFSITGGARFTYARIDGEPSFRPRVSDYVQGRSTRRVDPTLAFSWRLTPDLALFGRAQTGYRTGGLAVARGIGRVADFESDTIRVGEIGLRRLRRGETGIGFTTTLSLARWNDIQADLINRFGFPYTANIGDARVQAWEGAVDWVPIRGLRAALSFLQTHNTTSGELSDQSSPAHRRLPDTPPFAATADLGYRWSVGGLGMLSVGGSAFREGRSVLGTGDLFDIDQGQFWTFGARVGLRRGRWEMSLRGDNVTNTRGNLFATGNPFELTTRSLATPLRPANVRLGVKADW